MTTIATDGNSIAADSLAVSGDLKNTAGFTKIWEFNGDYYGASGLLNDLVRFQEYQKDPESTDITRLSDVFFGLKLTKKGVYFFDNELFMHKGAKLSAVGSGREIALGAMHAGASPREAVKIACKLNAFSGGSVRVLYLVF